MQNKSNFALNTSSICYTLGYKKNHIYAYKILSKNPFFYFNKSYGGFFIFLKIKQKITSDKFWTSLLKKYNVAVTSGKYFGKNFNNYTRISLSQKHLVFKKQLI